MSRDMNTPFDRLMAEAIPTRPAPAPSTPRPSQPARSWTPEEQAAHVAELLAALDGWHWHDDPRHLRLIGGTDSEAAA